MIEVKSAFYWRENMTPSKPLSERRSRKEVNALAYKVEKMSVSGMSTQEIAAELEITERYVQKLMKAET